MSLKNIYHSFTLLLCWLILPTPAMAGSGTCFLNNLSTAGSVVATALSGTYGFTASGVATGTNYGQIPVGNVVQSGTFVMNTSTAQVSTNGGTSNFAAFFNFNVNQLDTNGSHSLTNGQYYLQVNMKTCVGTFASFPGNETLSVVLVNGGDGMRISSTTPNLYLTFGTAQRL